MSLIDSKATVEDKKIAQFKTDYVNKKFDSITHIYGEIIDSLMRGEYDNKYNYKV